MSTEQLVRTVATLPDHDRTRLALSRLHDAGFNMDNICVITADDKKEVVSEPEDYDSVVDRVAEGSVKGATQSYSLCRQKATYPKDRAIQNSVKFRLLSKGGCKPVSIFLEYRRP